MITKQLLMELSHEYGLEYMNSPTTDDHYIFLYSCPLVYINMNDDHVIICRYTNVDSLQISNGHLYGDVSIRVVPTVKNMRIYLETCINRYKELKKSYRIKSIEEM